jgi:hypothetical protein
MIDDGLGFQLVPSRPALEQNLASKCRERCYRAAVSIGALAGNEGLGFSGRRVRKALGRRSDDLRSLYSARPVQAVLRPARKLIAPQVFPEADIDTRRGKVVVWDEAAVPRALSLRRVSSQEQT